MPRPNRHDGTDVWHHLLNRGIAERTIFETDADCRFFLSVQAREAWANCGRSRRSYPARYRGIGARRAGA